jgi:archaeal flagellin FlaB
MERKYVKRLVGKYCKIVTKEPGETRASAITGRIEDYDSKDGFIFVDSEQGLGCLKINTIVAIKPSMQHGHQKRKMNRDDHAAIGIGTLIVFIAMILVAAVAASVIIQTSETLQNRAYAVGKQTIREVSSGMQIVDLTGYTNEEKTRVEYLAITIRPRAGSYNLDLNQTLIYLQHDNLTVLSLQYNEVTSSVNSDGIFHTLNHSNLSSTDFGIIAVRDQDGSISNSFGIGTNDLAIVIINLTAAFQDTNGVSTSTEFHGRLVPEVGSAGIFMISTPNAFDQRVVQL